MHLSGQPIRRQSLVTAVTEKLREKIICGDLAEGEQLRQDALAAQLQVSRIPVREALRQLEAEGLITIVANRGAVVSTLSAEEIEELFEARAVLERRLLEKAMPRMTEQDLQRAEEALEAYKTALADTALAAEWGVRNWEFHSALYAPAQSPLMLALTKTLNNNCDRYTRLHLMFPQVRAQAGERHAQLLEVCRKRDAEAGRRMLWDHIMDSGQYLRQAVEEMRARRAASGKANAGRERDS